MKERLQNPHWHDAPMTVTDIENQIKHIEEELKAATDLLVELMRAVEKFDHGAAEARRKARFIEDAIGFHIRQQRELKKQRIRMLSGLQVC